MSHDEHTTPHCSSREIDTTTTPFRFQLPSSKIPSRNQKSTHLVLMASAEGGMHSWQRQSQHPPLAIPTIVDANTLRKYPLTPDTHSILEIETQESTIRIHSGFGATHNYSQPLQSRLPSRVYLSPPPSRHPDKRTIRKRSVSHNLLPLLMGSSTAINSFITS